MYFRRVQADDIDTLAPILRSEATMQALGGALSYEQTLDWIVEALHRRPMAKDLGTDWITLD